MRWLRMTCQANIWTKSKVEIAGIADIAGIAEIGKAPMTAITRDHGDSGDLLVRRGEWESRGDWSFCPSFPVRWQRRRCSATPTHMRTRKLSIPAGPS